jgi:AmiR/NasT family two-component response regulator
MKFVVVACDEALRRQLVSLLMALPGAMVVGQASAQAPAMALLRQLDPDVVLLSLDLAHGQGLNLLEWIRREQLGCDVYLIGELGGELRGDVPGASCPGAAGIFDRHDLDHGLLPRLQSEMWRHSEPLRLSALSDQ